MEQPANREYTPSPNLFIVGAARAGTTTLWEYLRQHPCVFMPIEHKDKEPAFFSDSVNPQQSKVSIDRYLSIFSPASEQQNWIGEASTVYLPDPSSPSLIHNFEPNARIIIILRNPAKRAYSHYSWMVQDGYEYASSFKRALELEETRKNKSIPNFWEPERYYNYLYFRSGLYHDKVKRYLDLFGENVLILSFERLKEYPWQTFDKLCQFLGVKPLENFEDRAYNFSRTVISPKLQFFLRKIIFVKMAFRKRLGYPYKSKEERDKLLKLGLTNQPPGKIPEDSKLSLIEKYKNDITHLSKLTGLDFTYWLNE